MTQTQLSSIIGDSTMNKWVNISDEFNIITFISEKKLFLMADGSSKQLFFNLNDNNLYVRFTDGKSRIPKKEEKDGILVDVPQPGDRWVSEFIENSEYWVKLVDGGITCTSNNNVGVYHEVWDIGHILGFFAPMV